MHMNNLEWCPLRLNGHPVFYRASKNPDPVYAEILIHIHGVGMSGTYMTPAADILARDYRSFVPDLPGFGRSAKTGTPPTIESLAESTRAFMDALDIDKATLIGNSMGCMTVMEFAHRYPERIARAVLCSPGRPVYQPLLRGVWQVARLTMREPLGMLPILVHDYVRCGVRDGLSLYRSMVDYPSARRFLALPVRTLILLGGKDPLAFRSQVEHASGANRRIQVVTIAQAGHTMNYSHPRETAAAIDAFLSVHAGEPPVRTTNGS